MDIKPNTPEEVELNKIVYAMVRAGQDRIGEGNYSPEITEKYTLTEDEQGKLFYILYGVLKVLLLDNGYEIKPK